MWQYAVTFIMDGSPMKRGVVNKKWREVTLEDATCGENDRRNWRSGGDEEAIIAGFLFTGLMFRKQNADENKNIG